MKVDVAADDVLNVRVDPDWKSEKTGELQPGASVLAFGEPSNGWLFIRAGELEGWVNGQFLVPAELMADPPGSTRSDVSAVGLPLAASVEPIAETEAAVRSVPIEPADVESNKSRDIDVEVREPLNSSINSSIDSALPTNQPSSETGTPLLSNSKINETSELPEHERPTFSKVLWAILGIFILLLLSGVRAATDEINTELRKPNLVGRIIWKSYKESRRRR